MFASGVGSQKTGPCCRRPCDGMPTLYYFDTPGRAESIRFCFLLGGVEFQDVRFPMDDTWLSHWKLRSPTGKAPWMEVHGERIPESRAILLYAAKKGNLIPADSDRSLHCQLILDLGSEVMDKIGSIRQRVSATEFSQKIGDYLGKAMREGTLVRMDQMVAKYQSAEGHVVGTLSYIDAYVAAFVNMVIQYLQPEAVDQFRRACTAGVKCRDLIYNMRVIQDHLRKYPNNVVLEYDPTGWRHKLVYLALDVAGVRYESRAVSAQETAPTLVLNGSQRLEGVEACFGWIDSRESLNSRAARNAAESWEITDTVRDLWGAYEIVNVETAEDFLSRVSSLDQRMTLLNHMGGPDMAGPVSVADIVCAAFYEQLSEDCKGMALPELKGLEYCYSRVFRLTSVKKGILARNKPTLYYFDLWARAESVRLLLVVAGVAFDDVRFGMPEWVASFKALSPTGQCPFVQMGNRKYAEALALLKMFGDLTNLVPLTMQGQAIADCVASVGNGPTAVAMEHYKMEAEAGRKHLDDNVPRQMDIWEKVVTLYKQAGTWMVENRMTWIDMFIAGEVGTFVHHYKAITMDEQRWPNLISIHKNVEELPAVVAYRAALSSSGSV
eukprot:Gregarina_sp_Poly_1__4060@NODE_222_length_11242_cov_244_139150_g196_i0_p2_GENE_NODE_222_length_11242_cov_244_139150_g196_i0NODE_222_length_11242_cov_244_139150_g196_i0_p2_ORF_typecomplete_len609_score78_42GST_N/PF02798_20/1_5e10GST_N/PF02798_20/1_1e03GST_N/PF02798_20/4_7e06GST_N/PF02798_20/2_6e03GST_C_3/PF14497_6/1_8GST_C_3/PF14497_6/75GST_C_3/PF14497_6/5_1e10GST_N_3/PF13417_6/0_013GST_N_3/PF13417_6/1_1e02GST_N_3/PF13417_6/1_7e03GST_N_3/PF13417_6/0_12GST_N_4/PF17172_4/0_00074GST_N_4/PF17172_4/1_